MAINWDKLNFLFLTVNQGSASNVFKILAQHLAQQSEPSAATMLNDGHSKPMDGT